LGAKVVIIIDALGFDITESHQFDPPGLSKKGRVKTVFGFSQAALTSIMTGAAPQDHKLWMMYSFDQKGSPFHWLRNMPRFVSTERRWLRRIVDYQIVRNIRVSAYYNLYDVPSRALSYLDIPARKQLFTPDSVPGCETLIDKGMKKNLPVFIRYYDIDEKVAFQDLRDALAGRGGKNNEGLFLLYTAGFDSTLHRFGTQSQQTRDHLRWYEEELSKVLSAGDDIDLFLFGDHGMCDVTSSIDLISIVEKEKLSIPDDYIPFYDSTMGRFRINSEKGKDRLESCLAELSGGRILKEEELRALGVWFDDGRFGDLIFLADPGVMIVPCFMGKKPIAGMHGYHPDASCMDSALYMNNDRTGDGISLLDIAPMILPDEEWKGSL